MGITSIGGVAALLAVLFQSTTSPSLPDAGTFLLTVTDGPTRPALLRTLSEEKVVVAGGEQESLEVSPERFVRIVRESALTRQAMGTSGLTLYLRDGEQFPGSPAAAVGEAGGGGGGEFLTWRHPTLGVLRVPLKLVAGVVRVPQASILGGSGSGDDVAVLLNGDTLRGVLSGTSGETLTLSPATGEPTTVPWTSLKKLALADLASKPPAVEAGYAFELADGTKARATSVSIVGSATTVKLAFGGEATVIPTVSVMLLERMSAAAWSLSLLKPIEVTHTPFLTAAHPPQFDATWSGGILRYGGKAYPRGIAMAAKTRITWELPEAFGTLKLAYGMEESAPRGTATLRILAGDQVVHEAVNIKPEAGAAAVSVELKGAKRVTIEVDFGASAGVDARVVVLDPILMK